MQKSILATLVFLAACAPLPFGDGQAVSPTATLPPPHVVIVTLTPSPIPTPTPTFDELIYPYTIEGLREHEYQSGEIHIRETLVENESYTIYYIDYPSDGLTITGVMYVPAGEGPFPVIVMNHGYFNRADFYSGDGTDRASEFLVQRGYIAVSPDYRSWGDSDIGHSFFYSGLAIDVINLLNAVPSIPQADPERIGMWGHSMGGGVTLKALTIDARVRAAVLYSTVSADFADVLGRWGMGCFGDIAAGEDLFGCNSSDIIPDTLPRELQEAYRFAAGDPETVKRVSPYYYLASIHVPVQIHYGAEDGNFIGGTPPEWSKKLYQGFLDAGREDVQLFGYDGEGHSFKADSWRAFMERAERLFDVYVKNTEIP